MKPDSINGIESGEALTTSVQELESTIAAYHKMVLDQEKVIARLTEQDLGVPMLVSHQDTYRLALFIEAGVRLMALLFVWILIAIKSGFTWTIVLIALATLVAYLGLELLDVSDRMRKVKKAIYR